jgi:hypothetical protein
MDSLVSVVLRAPDGDVGAFGLLVRRFQDMAVGYATSIVKKRLFTARQRLQETLMDLMEESLRKTPRHSRSQCPNQAWREPLAKGRMDAPALCGESRLGRPGGALA